MINPVRVEPLMPAANERVGCDDCPELDVAQLNFVELPSNCWCDAVLCHPCLAVRRVSGFDSYLSRR